MLHPLDSSTHIVSSSLSVIFPAPKLSKIFPDFFVMRRIVSVKLSLSIFSRSKAWYAWSLMEIVLVPMNMHVYVYTDKFYGVCGHGFFVLP